MGHPVLVFSSTLLRFLFLFVVILSFSYHFFPDKLTEVDSGFYSCAAVSSSGSVMSRAELRVVSSATALRHPPIIELGPANQGYEIEFET